MLTNMMNTENPLPQQAHTFVFLTGNQTKSAKKVVPFGLGLLHWIVVTLKMFCLGSVGALQKLGMWCESAVSSVKALENMFFHIQSLIY